MTFLKNIFGRIFALWALIVFAVMMIIMFIPTWITLYIKEPKGTAIFRKMSRFFMDLFLILSGFPPKVKGEKNFKEGQTYVVVCNHRSLLDVPMSTPHIPGPNKTIAKKEMASIPVFGMMYKRGSILVDRKSDKSRRESIEQMKDVLANGMHMCIYPEGTRNKTGKPLKSFYDGAFKLASDTGTAIIPAIIFNTDKALPIHKPFYVWPHALSIHFLPAIEVSKNENVPALREKVYKVMWDYYEANER
jgi:1-acyl-sn-glycerol-3-phosphate acyltransferase